MKTYFFSYLWNFPKKCQLLNSSNWVDSLIRLNVVFFRLSYRCRTHCWFNGFLYGFNLINTINRWTGCESLRHSIIRKRISTSTKMPRYDGFFFLYNFFWFLLLIKKSHALKDRWLLDNRPSICLKVRISVKSKAKWTNRKSRYL